MCPIYSFPKHPVILLPNLGSLGFRQRDGVERWDAEDLVVCVQTHGKTTILVNPPTDPLYIRNTELPGVDTRVLGMIKFHMREMRAIGE